MILKQKKSLVYFLLLFVVFFCREKDTDEQISKLILEESYNQRLEILYKKEINFFDSPFPQKIYIFRNINQEILAFIYIENETPKLYKKIIFTSPFYGKYVYDSSNKRWLAKNYSNPKELCIIQKIEFFQLGDDPFYSVFLEILTEEPPLPLASVPLVYREGKMIFNGMEELFSKSFLQKNRYSTFEYSPQEQKLQILTSEKKVVLTYIYEEKKFSFVPQ